MTLKDCPCGGAAAIRSERIKPGGKYFVWAECTSCGRRGRQLADKEKPTAEAPSYLWARIAWNCEVEQEGKA